MSSFVRYFKTEHDTYTIKCLCDTCITTRNMQQKQTIARYNQYKYATTPDESNARPPTIYKATDNTPTSFYQAFKNE